MSREIKFRGKRVDNGEWIYGSLINNTFQTNDGKILMYIIDDDMEYDCSEHIAKQIEDYEVIPETVGQYIGIEDDNKKEIYEGDITRVYGGEYCQGYYEYDNKCEVKWQTCGFDMVVTKEGYGIGLGFCDYSEHIKILGNKTDNPELLQN